ncbi:MAG: MATE family efflux transporter [Tannerellaceae bacterium]|nr:MATE family efflux transporter [Tannerellaceae bacterium]
MNKSILRLAIPNIITNITVPLLGMVDTSIVGHLDSPLYIGAIAIGTMIFNFVYWNFAFLRMGTSGFTSQVFGAEDKQEQVTILYRSLMVAFSIAFLLLVFQLLFLHIAFYFVDAGPEMKQYVTMYYSIYIWAAPAVLGMFALSGWFIGMQDAKTPMYISIFTNLVNIGFSLFLVYGLKMKIEGVALGSLLSQWIAFALALFIWNRKYGYLKSYVSFADVRKIVAFKPFFKVNSDIFLRSLSLVLVTTFFTSASAKNGEIILAVNSLLMQLFILFSYIMDGFAFAAEALTGKYVGAKRGDQLRIFIRQLFLWGGGLTAFFTILYAFFSKDILSLLTDKPVILAASASYHIWAILFPVAGFAAFLWDGIFIGMTASRQMRNSMFVAVGFFFILYFILSPVLGNNGLWLAFISYLAMRGLVQTFLFGHIKKQLGM